MATVLVNHLNIRTEPSIHSRIDGYFNKGDKIYNYDALVFECPYIWVRFYKGGKRRYVCKSIGTSYMDEYVDIPDFDRLPQIGDGWD